MAAYLILTREQTLDATEMKTYWDEVGSTLEGHEIKLQSFYGNHEDLEGPPTEGTVIAEFPSMAAAKAWYDSPAYREVREHRFKGAVYRVLLINGL